MILQIFDLDFLLLLYYILLHRGVQKWLIAKYCSHFFFITLVLLIRVIEQFYYLIIRCRTPRQMFYKVLQIQKQLYEYTWSKKQKKIMYSAGTFEVYSCQFLYCKSISVQVALTIHRFTFHDPHFTRGLYFCQMDSHYVMHYTISSLYTVKKPLSK